MNKLVISNLLHRPVRSLISVLAVAIEVVMILSTVAMLYGQLDDNKTRTSGVGADMIVRPPNASFLSAVSSAAVPAAIAPKVLAKLPHVAAASPVITNLSTGKSLETLWGIDYESFDALKPFVYMSGGPFQGPYDLIVDDIFAQADNGHHVGETLMVLNHRFRICGIVEHGKGGRKFLPITTLGELMSSDGKATLFYLRSDDIKNQELIRKEVLATPGMGDYQVQTMQEWLSMMTPEHLPGFTPAVNSVVAIAAIVGFLVIFQAMYTAILERTREIGILKSLGASRSAIVDVVLRETILLTISGIILGILMTYGVRAFMNWRMPTIFFEMTSEWMIRGSLIAFIGGVAGAVYPALKASNKDPIDALAYE
jgi:putative ABC transport system permease protein